MTRFEIDARQIAFVQCDDDRDFGGANVADGFFGLWHHAVVGGDHQHRDIGDVGTAGTHLREGLVARRIHEADLAPVLLDLVGANVLGDAARLARDDVDADDAVQQRCLAVVDVAQEGDHRGPRTEQTPGDPRGLRTGRASAAPAFRRGGIPPPC